MGITACYQALASSAGDDVSQRCSPELAPGVVEILGEAQRQVCGEHPELRLCDLRQTEAPFRELVEQRPIFCHTQRIARGDDD